MSYIENQKTCTKCGKTFPATDEYFFKKSDGTNDLRAMCKKCFYERANERRKNKFNNRIKNPDNESLGGQGNENDRNGMWVGENISYEGLHAWLSRHKTKTGVCSRCGNKGKTNFHNISGNYERNVDDYEELCLKCHTTKDQNRIRRDLDNNLIKDLYFSEELSTTQIGMMLNTSARTINNRLIKMGIGARNLSEAQKIADKTRQRNEKGQFV